MTALIITIVAYFFLFPQSRPQKDGRALWDDYEIIEKEVEGKTLRLIVADSPGRWQQGLMFVRKPVDFDGMIFISNTPKPHVFWNMNTFVDLDVYWLRKGEVVGKSYLPSIEKGGIKTVSSPGLADSVIEVIK